MTSYFIISWLLNCVVVENEDDEFDMKPFKIKIKTKEDNEIGRISMNKKNWEGLDGEETQKNNCIFFVFLMSHSKWNNKILRQGTKRKCEWKKQYVMFMLQWKWKRKSI